MAKQAAAKEEVELVDKKKKKERVEDKRGDLSKARVEKKKKAVDDDDFVKMTNHELAGDEDLVEDFRLSDDEDDS